MTTQAFQELYERLTSQVQAIPADLSATPPVYEVMAIKHMDIWRDQLTSEDERIEAYPAVFWEYSARYNEEDRRGTARHSEENLTARIVFENQKYKDTYLNSVRGNAYLNVEGMSFLATKEAVRKALNGFTGRYLKGLRVVSEELDTDEKGKTIIVLGLRATIVKSDCI